MVLLLIFFLLISLSAFSGFLLLQSSLLPLRPLFLSLLRHLLVLLASLLVLVLSTLLLHALLLFVLLVLGFSHSIHLHRFHLLLHFNLIVVFIFDLDKVLGFLIRRPLHAGVLGRLPCLLLLCPLPLSFLLLFQLFRRQRLLPFLLFLLILLVFLVLPLLFLFFSCHFLGLLVFLRFLNLSHSVALVLLLVFFQISRSF